jgi:actin related protein 2/3 complex subunit 3
MHELDGQVYHSSFVDDDGIKKACSCPLLPLKTHIKGPAPASDPGTMATPNSFDDVLLLSLL